MRCAEDATFKPLRCPKSSRCNVLPLCKHLEPPSFHILLDQSLPLQLPSMFLRDLWYLHWWSVLSSMETQSLPHSYLYSLLRRRKAEWYDWEIRPLHRRFYIFQNQICEAEYAVICQHGANLLRIVIHDRQWQIILNIKHVYKISRWYHRYLLQLLLPIQLPKVCENFVLLFQIPRNFHPHHLHMANRLVSQNLKDKDSH